VDGIAAPSLATRELHNALLAREYYLGSGAGLPAWKQRVLEELRDSVKPVEPPVLDHIAAWGFKLTGGESLWFPRLISALLWVIGGAFLYLIGLRITNRQGAVVSLALYLFWPYGVLISRLDMPDPMMVALILAGAYTAVRYWEAPSPRRLALASGVAALATAAKPGIGLIFLAILFTALACAQHALWRTLRHGTLLLYVAVAAAPTAAYFVYGSYVHHFLSSEGDAGERLQPWLISKGWFWRGWWEQLSIVLPFPQQQRDLAIIPLAAAVAGLVVVRSRVGLALLVGLGLGYAAYAVLFAGYTPGNAYYVLPLIPILALAIGSFAGFLSEKSGAATLTAAALVVLIVAVGAYKSRPSPVDREAISDYRRIGAITHHTTKAIILDERLRAPAMYWGWIVGHYWYAPTPGQDLPATGNPFPAWIDPRSARYLVVIGTAELRSERRLKTLIRDVPVVARTNRYAVFDVSHGFGSSRQGVGHTPVPSSTRQQSS
jgi:MFS family permease